jgi:ankyrin repeat protein
MAEPESYAYLGPVSVGDLDGIRRVAAAGTEINGAVSTAPPKHSYSPLTLAIENEDLASVTTLLEVGADPDATDPMGRVPLRAALSTVTLDTTSSVEAICLALIAAGATVTPDVVARAHDSFNWMGEPMYSEQFLARLTELGTPPTTTSEDSE